MFAKWQSWDASTNRKSPVQFDDSVPESGEHPYCTLKAQDEWKRNEKKGAIPMTGNIYILTNPSFPPICQNRLCH